MNRVFFEAEAGVCRGLGTGFQKSEVVPKRCRPLAWIMLFCATVLFAQFNNTINDPRDTYVKMRVCRLRIISVSYTHLTLPTIA